MQRIGLDRRLCRFGRGIVSGPMGCCGIRLATPIWFGALLGKVRLRCFGWGLVMRPTFQSGCAEAIVGFGQAVLERWHQRLESCPIAEENASGKRYADSLFVLADQLQQRIADEITELPSAVCVACQGIAPRRRLRGILVGWFDRIRRNRGGRVFRRRGGIAGRFGSGLRQGRGGQCRGGQGTGRCGSCFLLVANDLRDRRLVRRGDQGTGKMQHVDPCDRCSERLGGHVKGQALPVHLQRLEDARDAKLSRISRDRMPDDAESGLDGRIIHDRISCGGGWGGESAIISQMIEPLIGPSEQAKARIPGDDAVMR